MEKRHIAALSGIGMILSGAAYFGMTVLAVSYIVLGVLILLLSPIYFYRD